MPSPDRFPVASARRSHGRLALLGGSIALAALIAVPVVGQWDRGVMQVGGGTGNATAEQASAAPTPAALPAVPAAAVVAAATPLASLPALAAPSNTPPTAAAEPASPAVNRAAASDPVPRIEFGRALAVPAIDTLKGYVWPLAHPRLTLPFGPTPWGSRLVKGKQFHDGVDLATFCGDRVMAAHAGTVLAAGRHFDEFMGWVGDLGPYFRRLDAKRIWGQLPIVVVIDDGNGYRSMYAHFGSVMVKKGQHVRAGQLLGYEGATGRASGCHVHYGLFSPRETATFAIVPDVAKRMRLPATEIARVDPLKILPPRRGINERKAPKAPKASPTASPAS